MRLTGASVIYSDSGFFNAANRVVALKDISLHVRPGEKVGIIGSNGAGKSTLMRVMSGVLMPNVGIVDSEGMSTALLSLNAGFDGALSGVRNIVMHGMLMGLTRMEAASRIEAVTRMSGLGDAIHRRVSTYSNGMRARLCFSTAIHLSPDLLLLDEVFSVGDRDFRAKSERLMLDRFSDDKAIVMVSHNLPAVKRLCERAIWLDQGSVLAEGEAGHVIARYYNHVRASEGISEKKS